MFSYNETFNQAQFKISTNGRLGDSFLNGFYEPEEETTIVDCATFNITAGEIQSYRPVLLDIICGNPKESLRGILKQYFGYWEFTKINEEVNENYQKLVTKKGIFNACGGDDEYRALPEALIFYFPSKQSNRITFGISNKEDKAFCHVDLLPICLEKETIFCWENSEMYSILHR